MYIVALHIITFEINEFLSRLQYYSYSRRLRVSPVLMEALNVFRSRDSSFVLVAGYQVDDPDSVPFNARFVPSP
jgi:hypothetical protein